MGDEKVWVNKYSLDEISIEDGFVDADIIINTFIESLGDNIDINNMCFMFGDYVEEHLSFDKIELDKQSYINNLDILRSTVATSVVRDMGNMFHRTQNSGSGESERSYTDTFLKLVDRLDNVKDIEFIVQEIENISKLNPTPLVITFVAFVMKYSIKFAIGSFLWAIGLGDNVITITMSCFTATVLAPTPSFLPYSI